MDRIKELETLLAGINGTSMEQIMLYGLLIMVIVFVGIPLLEALFLWMTSRLMRFEKVSFFKALLSVAIGILAGGVFFTAASTIFSVPVYFGADGMMVVSLLNLLLIPLATAVAAKFIFSETVFRSIAAVFLSQVMFYIFVFAALITLGIFYAYMKPDVSELTSVAEQLESLQKELAEDLEDGRSAPAHEADKTPGPSAIQNEDALAEQKGVPAEEIDKDIPAYEVDKYPEAPVVKRESAPVKERIIPAEDYLVVFDMIPSAEAELNLREPFRVQIKYGLASFESALIWVKPSRFKGKNYWYSPSYSCPKGWGKVEREIAFNSPAHVTEIGITMIDAKSRTKIREVFYPVNLRWIERKSKSADFVKIVNSNPSFDAFLGLGEAFNVEIEYRLASTDNAVLRLKPVKLSKPPGFYNSSLPVDIKNGRGSVRAYFAFDKEIKVYEIVASIIDKDTGDILCKTYKDVNLKWTKD
ncbi:MAG: hypothetical protein GXP46_02960 [Deferribacteres bacterium]|nr:hypothetical protein [Deferribacteres bacterium]